MVQKFCLVCTPRSGSYYLLDHIARYFDLENGKEWFGRVKKVHYEGLRTSPVDIDHSVNEGLLTEDLAISFLIQMLGFNEDEAYALFGKTKTSAI